MDSFTAAEVILIITAVSGLVITAGGQIVNIVVALRTRTKVNEVNVKTDAIAGHVNGAAAVAAAKADALQAELVLMRKLFADQKETAAVLAQAQNRSPHTSRATDAPE